MGEHNFGKCLFISETLQVSKPNMSSRESPKPRSIQTALVVWHHDCVLNELQSDCKAALDQKSPMKYQLIIKTWRSFKTQGHCGSSLINTPLIYSQMLQERQEFLLGVGEKNRFMYESRFNVLTIRIDSKVLKIDIFLNVIFKKITCCGRTKKTEVNH